MLSGESGTFFVLGEGVVDRFILAYYATLLCLLFGGIHCIGWDFSFPSRTEHLLWRISSAAITGIPFLFAFGHGMQVDFLNNTVFSFRHNFALLPLYVLFRLVLLVLSLITLRSLPASALQTVEWTTFLPHI
jgi:hypothetical protein